MFSKSERSSFKYWFAHWCAFQMTALNLKCWHPRFILHDWYKPWMKLFCTYKTVQHYHRTHSSHHPESHKKHDYLAMVIDWECSRFTKQDAPLTARQTLYKHYPELEKEILPILDKLNL